MLEGGERGGRGAAVDGGASGWERVSESAPRCWLQRVGSGRATGHPAGEAQVRSDEGSTIPDLESARKIGLRCE